MPTTLVDHLRRMSDRDLGALFGARPDLAVPVPTDLSALASRAQSRLSLARALEGLDRFTLEILDALRLATEDAGSTTLTAVLDLATGAPAERVREAVTALRRLAVAYGPDDAIGLARGVSELCSPYPAGLGRPAVELDPEAAVLAADPARLRRELLAAPPEARAVLDRLAAGPPVGTVREAGAGTPVGWLLDHHLLVAERLDTVQLPREVGLLLRREVGPLGELHPDPPTPDATVRPGEAIDAAGAGQVMEVVRLTAALCDALAAEPAAVLKAGGVGIRDLRRLARAVDSSETVTALLLELARETQLVTDAETAEGAYWLPTRAYDDWRLVAPSARWLRLATCWLAMARQPSLVGTRDDKDRPINALSGEIARMSAPVLRNAALTALADLPAGSAPGPEALVDLLAWRTPRRGGPHAGRAIRAALGEAATLGVTGRDALTSYGRLLLADDRPAPDPLGIDLPDSGPDPAAILDDLLPAPVDHVLVQADLTVVVPGPPEPGLAAELDLVADTESAGHAAVYRVTPDSVRRALDAGMAAQDLHTLFARRSTTPVPQALTYLVDDVARRHGGLRVGACSAYLRSEDTTLLAELAADRRLTSLALREIAPTVLVSPYQVHRLLDALRGAGYAPVPEDAGGVLLTHRPDQPRAAATTRLRPTARELPAALTTEQVAQVVATVRHGDQLARTARRAPVPDPRATTDALAVLRDAIRAKTPIWVTYVDSHGGTASRLVRPVSIGAGYLRAADDRTETLHTFSLARITSASPSS
ncbi:MAG TPA: helicase-associated domain-containing protein [Actinocatenispora sp.]